MQLRQYTREDIQAKRVLLRCDFDVAVNEDGRVDKYHDLRLERLVPTLAELFSLGAKQVVMVGHRGRPQGKPTQGLSLAPVCERLRELAAAEGLDEPIAFVEDVSADPASHRDQDAIMLENVRFSPGEKDGDVAFARQLARWGEVYVNDAFGASHRSDASVTLVPREAPCAFAGPELAREVRELEGFLDRAKEPFVAIVGGAKISTKLPLLALLAQKANRVLLGGALANTILASRGVSMGASLVEEAMLQRASELSDSRFELPTDAVVTAGNVVSIGSVSPDQAMFDIGPQTIKRFVSHLGNAKTILWNGPMGKFEDARFSAGTIAVARAAAANKKASALAGGGETVELLERLGLVSKFDFVSTGGGAMLMFLVGGDMPGLDAVRI